jgi:general secretion pathway protein A
MTGIRDYLPFFNLKTLPFRLSPDPEFFFPSRPHRAALEVLKFAVERGEGFMVLTGCAGTGKTLLLRLLLKELPETKLPAVVVTPAVSPEGLVRLLLDELGISVEETHLEFAVLLKRLQDALIELAASGRELLVIIDESQDLPVETLEQLRLLSNIELDDRKIIQILLMGQSELDHVLAHPGLRQLVQRIVVNETLSPLSLQETGDYITFRLARAGRADLEITGTALRALFEHTGGIPRMINRLMDRALLMAAARGAHGVSREDIAGAAGTLPAPVHLSSKAAQTASPGKVATWPHHNENKRLLYWMVAAASLFMAVGGTWWLTRHDNLSHMITALSHNSMSLSETASTGAPLPAAAQTPEAGRQVMVVVNRALVRKGPGDRFEFISAVSSGDLLTSRGRDGEWVMVDAWDASGKKGAGWIRDDLVREIPMMEVQIR